MVLFLYRKRQKLEKADNFSFGAENLEEPEFFNQMGIGILDSDQSPSSDFEIFDAKNARNILNDNDDEDLIERADNIARNNDEIDTAESPVPALNFIPEMGGSIEVYSDDVEAGPSLRNTTLTKVMAMSTLLSSGKTKRSPLAPVTTNTKINAPSPQATASSSKQRFMSLYNEEKYFAFKKILAEKERPSKHFFLRKK